MTADERIEKLVNAGFQTIGDLPDRSHINESDVEQINEYLEQVYGDDIDEKLRTYSYIAHLTDVIDRMEYALMRLIRMTQVA